MFFIKINKLWRGKDFLKTQMKVIGNFLGNRTFAAEYGARGIFWRLKADTPEKQ